MKLETFLKTEDYDLQKDIISKINDVIIYKNLESGDRLPSERTLAEKFEVSRSSIRAAIQKLEFYGVLKSIPQSGTYIANIGVVAINGIIKNLLRLDSPDFKSLVQTRILLELKITGLAAVNRTDADLKDMEAALQAYKDKVLNKEDAVQEDLLFHLAIAKAGGNTTMNSIMLMITPEIIMNFEKYHICDEGLSQNVINEHQAVFDAIKNKDSKLAQEKMKEHFKVLYEYCNH
ncbi:FadR family transcriptional regulator [Winogradskyella litoriviva]|uniref:FadR family transcriptional regulator n=1 Tax=Winogradskyella litoriviva TaxID=1220182 RepID=A0ABX2E3S4_9FLAO|nr:FadR/GntR family transcriptional regulator [Winogradskyella litoriviva]NRD23088.1 FadR family transcriptional regulator [Winogradskyella litoriviva]